MTNDVMYKKLSIKAWRTNANLTQQDVADILGVTKQTVINWEKSKTKPNGLIIYALAKLYKTEVDYIEV
ncbi:helix-turn-helix transcriptional regulator [Macrococcus equipercicus]